MSILYSESHTRYSSEAKCRHEKMCGVKHVRILCFWEHSYTEPANCRQMLVFQRSVVIIKGPGSCQVQKIKRLIRTEKQEKWKTEIDDIGCCSSYPCFLSSGLGMGNIGDTSHSLPCNSTNIMDLKK